MATADPLYASHGTLPLRISSARPYFEEAYAQVHLEGELGRQLNLAETEKGCKIAPTSRAGSGCNNPGRWCFAAVAGPIA
jgi:hypothetical protein